MADQPPRLTDADFAGLTQHIQELLAKAEALPFPNVQEDLFELLNSLDLLHREVFSRMLERVEVAAPDLIPEFERDLAIRTVLMLYDFLPEEAEPDSTGNATFIPLDQITVSPGLKRPIWLPGGTVSDILPGTCIARTIEDVQVLLCNIEGQLYAYKNACLDSILPLDKGHLEGHMLTCPWHNCRYDLKSGEIQNGSGLKLEQYPIKFGDDGRFTIGFNIPKYSY
ncbi:MAG: Rieske (2Fe-2S) protein [Anaerolineae bacterium]|nr:Rieske (2Fe-2S) protein [Anaerolineae bacterium]